MFGGAGNDWLTGTSDGGLLAGGAGDDLIDGGGTWMYGDDLVRGDSIQFFDTDSMAAGGSLALFFTLETLSGPPASASLTIRAGDRAALAPGDAQQMEVWYTASPAARFRA